MDTPTGTSATGLCPVFSEMGKAFLSQLNIVIESVECHFALRAIMNERWQQLITKQLGNHNHIIVDHVEMGIDLIHVRIQIDVHPEICDSPHFLRK